MINTFSKSLTGCSSAIDLLFLTKAYSNSQKGQRECSIIKRLWILPPEWMRENSLNWVRKLFEGHLWNSLEATSGRLSPRNLIDASRAVNFAHCNIRITFAGYFLAVPLWTSYSRVSRAHHTSRFRPSASFKLNLHSTIGLLKLLFRRGSFEPNSHYRFCFLVLFVHIKHSWLVWSVSYLSLRKSLVWTQWACREKSEAFNKKRAAFKRDRQWEPPLKCTNWTDIWRANEWTIAMEHSCARLLAQCWWSKRGKVECKLDNNWCFASYSNTK